MAIKSIRLQNYKGFKDATLELKPLTVLLGPNSAGKSSFGQALVALSKSNSRDKVLSLSFEPSSSIALGNYSDLVHADSHGQAVMIEIGLESGTLKFGFGGGNSKNPLANINELDLTLIEVGENLKIEAKINDLLSDSVSQTVTNVLPASDDIGIPREVTTFSRDNDKVWSVYKQETVEIGKDTEQKFKIFFDGVDIEGVSHLTGTAVAPREVVPVIPFQDLGSLLEKITYLRPDRVAPRREEPLQSTSPTIDDWGGGVPWYIQKYGDSTYVDTFTFKPPSSDTIEAQKNLNELARREKESKSLLQAVSDWLVRIGLAVSFETKLIDGGRAVQALAAPPGQVVSRPLVDVGFGVSQVLPILAKGLLVKDGGLFIVEQPEAQLHPKPQAELADFFCSMIKCGRSVLVETHSEALFHRLRILAAMDDYLYENIAVYFIDEPHMDAEGVCRCSTPRLISLDAGAEFNWPIGFLSDGVETEMQVRATRLAKKRAEVKH